MKPGDEREPMTSKENTILQYLAGGGGLLAVFKGLQLWVRKTFKIQPVTFRVEDPECQKEIKKLRDELTATRLELSHAKEEIATLKERIRSSEEREGHHHD